MSIATHKGGGRVLDRLKSVGAVLFFLSACTAEPVSQVSACTEAFEMPRNNIDDTIAENCIAELPTLAAERQVRIVTRYARDYRAFIHQDEIDTVSRTLVPDAERILASFGSIHLAGKGLEAERIADLTAQARTLGDDLSLAYLEWANGLTASLGGDQAGAIMHWTEARRLAGRENAERLIARLEFSLGAAERALGNIEPSRDHLITAFDLFVAQGLDRQVNSSCRQLRVLFSNLGADGQRAEIMEQAEIHLEAAKGKRWLLCVQEGIAIAHHAIDDHEAAYVLLQEAMSMRATDPVLKQTASSFKNLAVFSERVGDSANAVRHYETVLEMSEAAEDHISVVNTLQDLATIIANLGDYETAIGRYQQALDVYAENELNVPYSLILITSNIGESHAAMGHHAEALEWYEKAEDILADTDDKIYEGRVMFLKAKSLYEMGNPAAAMAAGRASLEYLEQDGRPILRALAHTWVATRELEAGELDAAELLLARARELSEPEQIDEPDPLSSLSSGYYELEYVKSMVALLTAKGDTEAAIPYVQAAFRMSEERLQNEQMAAANNANLLFELRDRDLVLQLLTQENLVKDLGLRESRLQSLVASLAAGLAALLALFLFRSYRTQRKLATARNTFLSEIHHRTTNNLQILSSLLSMDVRRSRDAPNQDVDNRLDAANRARTMALIHNHLYERGGTTEVDADHFLNDLLGLIEEGLGQDNISLESAIDDLSVDVDLLTPLGLLVCELVTNAYKHAFDRSGGTIRVTLRDSEEGMTLEVCDDGKGFDAEDGRSGSMGLELVESLAEQIGGSLTIKTGSSGTIWTLSNVKSLQRTLVH